MLYSNEFITWYITAQKRVSVYVNREVETVEKISRKLFSLSRSHRIRFLAAYFYAHDLNLNFFFLLRFFLLLFNLFLFSSGLSHSFFHFNSFHFPLPLYRFHVSLLKRGRFCSSSTYKSRLTIKQEKFLTSVRILHLEVNVFNTSDQWCRRLVEGTKRNQKKIKELNVQPFKV